MYRSSEVLASFANLMGQSSGADAVSFFIASGPGQGEDILIHHGPLPPLPELSDRESARRLERRFLDKQSGSGPSHDHSARMPSRHADGILIRVPLAVTATDTSPAGERSPRRRKVDRRFAPSRSAWIGFRFKEGRRPEIRQPEATSVPMSLRPCDCDVWLDRFTGYAGAFASYAQMISTILLDPVTALPMRAEFQTEMNAVLAQARKDRRPLTLMLVNPVDYSSVNERFDRKTGDAVLAEVAQQITAGLREDDWIARYGGAIFSVILPETSEEGARSVGEKLLRQLSDRTYAAEAVNLRMAIGAAVTGESDESPIGAQELLHRADQALAMAKNTDSQGFEIWHADSATARVQPSDCLQGIFTGDSERDYRNMKLVWESVQAMAVAASDPDSLCSTISEALASTFGAGTVAIFQRDEEDRLECLFGLGHASGEPGSGQDLDLAAELVEKACEKSEVLCGDPASPTSRWAVPMGFDGRCLGGIYMEGRPDLLNISEVDAPFIRSLADQVALTLDRARLVDLELRRQKDEKERLEAELADLRRVLDGSKMAYRSERMDALVHSARKIAPTDATVLLTGESGTGKEVLARTIHSLSLRRGKPMVVLDCGAISPTLIESELFGHERGAFTGAHARKAGRLSEADGATLFLDEIGELPLDVQSKLLRFVQEKQFTPVGGAKTRTVDVRIIAATNVDLGVRAAEGQFREDLFHRLNVMRLELPPLRERRGDILHLAQIFLQHFGTLYRKPGLRYSARAERVLESWSWPGNVRELQNCVIRAVLLIDGDEIDTDDLNLPTGPELDSRPPDYTDQPVADPAHDDSEHENSVSGEADDVERMFKQAISEEVEWSLARSGLPEPLGRRLAADLVLAAERTTRGVGRRAAELLGIPETTYRRRLNKARDQHGPGHQERSPAWVPVLEALIRGPRCGSDICAWAGGCLLDEILTRLPGDPRTGARVLGVTEQTFSRRVAERRFFQPT